MLKDEYDYLLVDLNKLDIDEFDEYSQEILQDWKNKGLAKAVLRIENNTMSDDCCYLSVGKDNEGVYFGVSDYPVSLDVAGKEVAGKDLKKAKKYFN